MSISIPSANSKLPSKKMARSSPALASRPYISVEDMSGGFKRLVREFLPDKNNQPIGIPKLHFNVEYPSVSPFLTTEEAALIWKRKEEKKTNNQDESKQSKKGGWCECCNLKFSDMDEHLSSLKHKQFALNEVNYKQVDSILASLGS